MAGSVQGESSQTTGLHGKGKPAAEKGPGDTKTKKPVANVTRNPVRTIKGKR